MAKKLITRLLLVCGLSFSVVSLTACDKIIDYINNNCTSGKGSVSCGGSGGDD